MRIKSNFCGIFATAFIVTTTFVIASCSQDDDYYDSDMYTLAEKMETRSGGDPGGGGGQPSGDLTYFYANNITKTQFVCTNIDVKFTVNCWINLWENISPIIEPEIIVSNEAVVPFAEFKDYTTTKYSDHYCVEYKVHYYRYENDTLREHTSEPSPCRIKLKSIVLPSNVPLEQPTD